eukprot:CAMPEP_0170519764 /NCGR_PEP_ID=MMETSP0209-20121228/5057_1 /TAXON_ID=665100 ORGANISM="Litonotus pictus, Strain P1" /NCGR_SAMPLE_ID=MMETSP0209 /ASSEMBLY_ACC=CAM_ASM_000301 /LENGTH=101 /DNA_ID=CAMNT_0010805725 /DNA_START=191 /DNA_END=496 /DNA_ORIENTATION=-
MKEHRYECRSSEFSCTIESCKFKGTNKEMLDHFVSTHELHLILLAEQFPKLQNNYEKFDINNSSVKLNANNNMRELNKKMNNYKSEDMSEFMSESFFDEFI